MNKVITQFGSKSFQQKITAGEHQFLADVDAKLGGTNSGPSPHELLAAALCSCTGITLNMYAQRKAWPLSNAFVTVDISRTNQIEHFERTIELSGDLDAEQRARLLEIANKCPVHLALAGQIQISTQLINA